MSAEVPNTEPIQVKSGNVNQRSDKNNENTRLEAGSETEVERSSVPDGGWGWVVVFGSFMIHVINDGISHSFGVFVEDLAEYFDSSKSAVGAVGSLMLGISFLVGKVTIVYRALYSLLSVIIIVSTSD